VDITSILAARYRMNNAWTMALGLVESSVGFINVFAAFKYDGRSPSPTAEACTSGHAKLCDSLERSSWDDRIPYHTQDRGLRCRASQCANMATKGSAGDLGSKKAIGAQLGTSLILGPSCRVIDRTPIFYNSSFACHAGLPANRIL
jgi:hypothetical protein